MYGTRSLWRFSILAICLAQLCHAGGQYHRHDWSPDYVLVATAENYTINCQSRYSVIVNGTIPGPEIRLKENVTTWVRVWNRIPDQNFTLHWHGLSQRTSPFSDGTPLVSQWPIAPHEYFDYEITPQIGDAGSYFYHSHVGFQAMTAHGALIVDDACDPPYRYDQEETLMFGDFYPANDSVIESGLLADPLQWSGETQAVTIQGSSGNASFTNATDESCKPYVLNVEAGQTYRLRFIGRTAISLVTAGIEDHDNLTVIEADGAYTKPHQVDHLQVATGQRFSVLFQAKSTAELQALNKTQFWLRYETRMRPSNVSGYALVNYHLPKNATKALPVSLPAEPPVTLPTNVTNWLEDVLQPLKPTDRFPRLSEVTRTVYITMSQMLATGSYRNSTFDGVLQWGQNGLAWQENVLASQSYNPYLVDVYRSGKTPNYTAAVQGQGFDPATRAFPAKVGETLDIVWLSNSGPSGGYDVHPMHAHGAHYWDLGAGNGTYNATLNEQKFNGTYTPVRRDTTILYRYLTSGKPYTTLGWRAWRLRVTEDDVGAWMMHCHILQHMIMGMQTVWVFGDSSQILAKFPVEPYVQGYLDYGGSAYGNDSYDPLVYEYGQ